MASDPHFPGVSPAVPLPSQLRIEIGFDPANRLIHIKAWKPLAITPETVPLPFSMVKEMANRITAMEVQQEQHGRAPWPITSTGIGP